MRFASHLREIGDAFRRKHLDSTDEKDKTELEEDWTKMEVYASYMFINLLINCLSYLVIGLTRRLYKLLQVGVGC